MTGLAYISILLFALAGFVLLDRKYQLVFWQNSKWAALTLMVGVTFFAIWDVAGIFTDIFFTGDSNYIIGLMIAPDFPVEELFFLTLLCYQSLIFWELLLRIKKNA